ncbi:MAG: MFS transporter [Acidimicrobiia bacterium]|nr:MFS transporter [Acidimicrobiia bacterium]
MSTDYPQPRSPSKISRATRAVGRKIEEQFSRHGWAFRRLAISHATNVAGDALVALALADTLFFSVPTTEARGNVVAFLLLTLAPFAVIGPLLGSLVHRLPRSHRAGLAVGSLGRVVLVIAMMRAETDLVMLSMVFGILVLSRIYGISRSSILPTALPNPADLVEANARLARLGILAGGAILPIGLGAINLVGNTAALVLAAGVFAWSGIAAMGLRVDLRPAARQPDAEGFRAARSPASRRAVRHARIATAIVRLLNGYLLLLVAFVFRDNEAGIVGFGSLLLAAGAGFGVASLLAQFLARRLREEPMVVAALALEAAAAFISAHVFGVWSAAAVAFFAGLAWGTAKFGYDGLLHASVRPEERGRTFTYSETLFQLAWVVGAVIPVLVRIPATLGLILAGCAALLAQVVLVSALLISMAEPADTDPYGINR